jgi:hypothetical protein
MAKPITATPPVRGEAARIIQREIARGTPDTPARQATIRRADEVYRQASQRTTDDEPQ